MNDIKRAMRKISKAHCDENLRCMETCSGEERCEYAVAMESMQRRIPQAPYKKTEDHYGRITFYYCPQCRRMFGFVGEDGDGSVKKEAYCQKCGQAIDWEAKL